jgi:DNA-binding XRE family transcriptional regulator
MAMSAKRIHRRIERSAAQRRHLHENRDRLQKERPGPEDLLAQGDATEFVSLGEYLDLRATVLALKKRREKLGLSLADVAKRSGMDRAAISRLENGIQVNPTVSTLYRYGSAIGARIAFSVRVG